MHRNLQRIWVQPVTHSQRGFAVAVRGFAGEPGFDLFEKIQ